MTTSRLSTLTAAVTASAVLVLAPLAGSASASADEGAALPPVGGSTSEASAVASAPDQRLRAGCHDYPVRYAVRDAGDDWMLDLVVRDRSGEEVAAMSLHAVEHGAKGWATFSVCRAAVEAGRFTLGGVLTERDGYDQTEHRVERSAFWLTRD